MPFPPLDRPRASTWAAPACVAFGCAALVSRTISYESIGVVALVGAAGILPRLPAAKRRHRGLAWAAVTIAGCATFALGRALGSGVGVRLTGLGVATIVVAAVAEEAFFRRFVYGWLEGRGVAFAILSSAFLFAVVHLPTYGPGVWGIDFAAGIVLGWQRWASGTWTAPAATHVFANLLQMG
jgi:membrane protease YdiL (CAAX protease family)